MEFEDFQTLVGAAQARHISKRYPPEFKLFEFLAVSDDDIALVEAQLGTLLPAKYTQFLKHYGAGMFALVDLLPVRATAGRTGDLLRDNSGHWAISGFVSVAPVGSGDMWGFVSRGGRCEDAVSFWDHDDGHIQFDSDDFLEFLVSKGLRRSGPDE